MDRVRQAYRNLSQQYIDLIRTNGVSDDDLAFIERHLLNLPGPVLDAGCGPGHLTAHLRSLGASAVGIDVVPEFIDHARTSDPNGAYALGDLCDLPIDDGSIVGTLAWYSLIHLPPADLDVVLTELRRAMAPEGVLVVGFFDGVEHAPFDHKVTTAYFWPVDEFAAHLERAGFTEIERMQRPGSDEPGHRPHAAIAAIASAPATSSG